jgi:predicted amidohydrolase
MKHTIHLAVGQFPSVTGEARDNLASVERLACAAATDGAEFLLLPEDCLTGYPGAENSAAAVALSADGAQIAQLGQIAHGHGIAIAAGFIESAGSQLHSTHAIAWPDGTRTFIHKRSVDERDRRIGLTPVERENDDFEIGGVRAALAICMDGTEAFFSAAHKRQVRIILHPSGGACTVSAHASDPDASRIDAVEVENCRRCVEAARQQARRLNAAYCVANTVSFDGERGYPGNSWIISPAGELFVHLKGTAIIEQMHEATGAAAVKIPPLS